MSDLEKILLAKMTDTKELARVYEMGLRRAVFVEAICGHAFEWMIDYWLATNMTLAPSWVVMETEYPSIPLPHTTEEFATEWVVDTLKRRWITNKIQNLMLDAAKTSEEDPEATLSRLWHDAYDATEVVVPRYARVDMSQNVDARRQRYAHRHDRDHTGGVTLGLPELDAHTRGILPGELAAVAGYTKVGKTFLMLNAAVSARAQGWTPLIMTLEQSIEEIEERIDALASGVSYQRLQEGSLTISESTKLIATREMVAEMGPLHVEQPQRGERTVKNMCARARQIGADYLIIDQLSFMDGERDYTGDRATTAKHGDLIYDLKNEIGRASAGMLPCLLAVQQNRETQSKDSGGRGALKNFAHSSMIEQTVDLALGLWRTNEARANNSMMIDIMGARRCDLKSWILSWHLSDRTEVAVREELLT